MPIYDFECADCGPFVVMRRIADRDAACHCPDCGNEGTRVVTAPSLALMGSASRAAHATNPGRRTGGQAVLLFSSRRRHTR